MSWEKAAYVSGEIKRTADSLGTGIVNNYYKDDYIAGMRRGAVAKSVTGEIEAGATDPVTILSIQNASGAVTGMQSLTGTSGGYTEIILDDRQKISMQSAWSYAGGDVRGLSIDPSITTSPIDVYGDIELTTAQTILNTAPRFSRSLVAKIYPPTGGGKTKLTVSYILDGSGGVMRKIKYKQSAHAVFQMERRAA